MITIEEEIEQLKAEKNAVILAHYYAPGETQALADYVGDSYYLAKIVRDLDAKTVVFAGVGFMGESVKILNPDKTVLMPDMSADCPMAHMADVKKIEELRAMYDDLAVVCYINSTAELKFHSDVCVTSANAVRIVKALPNKNIYFIPDRNLGRHVAEQLPEKNIILNDGCCPIHAAVTPEQLKLAKQRHPNALVLAHPECISEVLELADYIGSTGGILKYAIASDHDEFIICTENGISYPLDVNCPGKKFYSVTESFCCPDMKLNTPEKVLHVLKTGENEVVIDEAKRLRALSPLDRMLELAQ